MKYKIYKYYIQMKYRVDEVVEYKTPIPMHVYQNR